MSRIPSDRGEEGRCPDFEERVLKLCACHPVLGLPVYLLYAPGTAPYGRSTPTGTASRVVWLLPLEQVWGDSDVSELSSAVFRGS